MGVFLGCLCVLIGCVDQEILVELIKQKVPEVASHMDKESVPWSIPTTKWFIYLFLDVLPIEVRESCGIVIFKFFFYILFVHLC